MDTLYLGGKILYGGIGDLVYCIFHDPILQRIAFKTEDKEIDLSIWTNRDANVASLFATGHFRTVTVNADSHKPMMRVRTTTDIPEWLQDKKVGVFPVPTDGFQLPKKPYMVAHLEVEEADNEVEIRPSLLSLMQELSRGIPVYLLGVGKDEFELPDNFIDLRGKVTLPQAFHYVLHAVRYMGLTSVWYLQSLLLKKPGWSFNNNHRVLYEKMLRLYPKVELLNSRIEAFDINYE